MACDSLDNVKINIRAIMSTIKGCMTYESLIQDYEEMIYQPLPLCGFKTNVELINSIPDVIQVIPGSPDRLRLVSSDKSKHVVKLVAQQRSRPSNYRKTFPSINRLNSLGIMMPPKNHIRESVEAKPKPLTKRVNPPRQYKWPAATELNQNNSKTERVKISNENMSKQISENQIKNEPIETISIQKTDFKAKNEVRNDEKISPTVSDDLTIDSICEKMSRIKIDSKSENVLIRNEKTTPTVSQNQTIDSTRKIPKIRIPNFKSIYKNTASPRHLIDFNPDRKSFVKMPYKEDALNSSLFFLDF